MNARALIGQSAMVYCASKLMEISHVWRHDKPLGMLERHEKNSYITSLRLVIYEFFSCSSNIPSGLSAYKP